MHPTYEYWFSIFKVQPVQELTLLTTLFSDKKTNRLVDELSRKPPTPKLKGILTRIKGGQLTVEELMSKLPNPNVTKEEIEERLQKILNTAKFETISSLGELLDEAISIYLNINNPNIQTSEAEENKLAELVEKITSSGKLTARTLRQDKKVREKLDYFNRLIKPKEKFSIKFQKISENREEFEKKMKEIEQIVVSEKKIGEETVKTYLGKLENDKFVTIFDSQAELLEFLSKNPEKKEKFMQAIADFAPDLGTVKVSRTKRRKRKEISKEKLQDLVARGVVFETSNISNFSGVESYLNALEKIPYSILPFIPSTLDEGKVDDVFNARTELPPTFFLTRESVKSGSSRGTRSLVLNPYALVLLRSSYADDNWFKTFFGDVRKSQIIGEGLAELMILDDIYDMIQLNKPSSYGFNRDRFGEVSLGDNREAGRNKLKEIINTDSTLKRIVDRKSIPISENLFNYLRTDFTVKEAKQIEALWDDDLEFEYGELGLEFRDSEGETDERNADYVTITLNATGDNEPVNPQRMKEILDEENKQIEMNQFRELVEDAIKDEEIGNRFVSYVLSLSNEELLSIVQTPADTSSNFADKLNPKNSLIFLSTISDRLIGEYSGLVSNAFERVANEESQVEKQKILVELNGKMAGFLRYLKESVFKAFQNELDDFAENYINVAGRSKDKAIRAIDAFKREGLLRGE